MPLLITIHKLTDVSTLVDTFCTDTYLPREDWANTIDYHFLDYVCLQVTYPH